jgi:hypothetical protein
MKRSLITVIFEHGKFDYRCPYGDPERSELHPKAKPGTT